MWFLAVSFSAYYIPDIKLWILPAILPSTGFFTLLSCRGDSGAGNQLLAQGHSLIVYPDLHLTAGRVQHFLSMNCFCQI